MRAYRLPQATGIEALVVVDLPTPKPGPRQVLVKVAACSLNFRDLAIALGTYRMPTKPNLIPLSDGAGEVVEVGAERELLRRAAREVAIAVYVIAKAVVRQAALVLTRPVELGILMRALAECLQAATVVLARR